MKAYFTKSNKESVYTVAFKVKAGERATGFRSCQYYPSEYSVVEIKVRRESISSKVIGKTNQPNMQGEFVDLPAFVLDNEGVKKVFARLTQELRNNCRETAKTAIDGEEAIDVTLREKGDEWVVTAKPSELWLEWAEGSVWWTPLLPGHTPEWAAALKGTWDRSWA